MEPIGLALSRAPFNIAAILFLVVIAAAVFVIASRAGAWDEEDDDVDASVGES